MQIESLEQARDIEKELANQGWYIYSLQGESIASLQTQGFPVANRSWLRRHKDFGTIPAQLLRLAIKPDELFIPGSNRLAFEQQKEAIEKESKEIGKEYPGVKMILPSAAEAVELALQHLTATGEKIYGGRYISTSDVIELTEEAKDPFLAGKSEEEIKQLITYRITVGNFTPKKNLDINPFYTLAYPFDPQRHPRNSYAARILTL